MNMLQKSRESGNAVIIVLVALVVVALGALAYLSTQMKDEPAAQTAAATTESAPAATETAAGEASEAPVPGQEIKPGNPVIAKVDGQDVTRMDVFNFIQTLPPQTRQVPLEQLFPMAAEQVINAKIIEKKTEGVDLSNDEEVKKQMELAKVQIMRTVYIQKEITKKLTDKRMEEAYAKYKQEFPKVDEVQARHILVKEEEKAKDLIKQLEGGVDFAELAKANSIDGTAQSGGELGYFAKTDVVPAFGDAAFAMDKGAYSKAPVKSDFGFHVIKVEDKRTRPVPSFEEAKPFIEAQLRRELLDELVNDWREAAKIERFNINGENVEPAAGQEQPAAGE